MHHRYVSEGDMDLEEVVDIEKCQPKPCKSKPGKFKGWLKKTFRNPTAKNLQVNPKKNVLKPQSLSLSIMNFQRNLSLTFVLLIKMSLLEEVSLAWFTGGF